MGDLIYYGLLCLLTFGVLVGIAMMSRVEKALYGNALSALSTAAAIILTLYRYNILSDFAILACTVLALAVGCAGAYRVKMIEMPQVVALLNGFGGAASALIAIAALLGGLETTLFSIAAAGLALCIGMLTLTGSLVAAGKLHKLLPQKPVVWKQHQALTTASIILMAVIVVVMLFNTPVSVFWYVVILLIASGFFGVAFAIRVGGADMPITISLLNSLSGVAGSIAGMAVSNPLLVAVGGIVGASGLILTQIMCRAMNRSLMDILLGSTTTSNAAAQAVPSAPAESVAPVAPVAPAAEQAEPSEKAPPLDPVKLLAEAKNVIIVPGYGMALAQAQELVKQLADKLEANGADVKYAIHPVAGRMPGHMNVLLCEVDVPYDKLYEIDDINPLFDDCDAAVVIGANDVVNPAANTAEGTPIYGMPVLNAERAKHVIVCNYDLQPGYAGVPNPLYSQANAVLLLGDAKESLNQLLQGL